MTVRLLAVCGSLQRRSANRAVLAVATARARTRGADVVAFDGIADLPAFDPDREAEPIAAVDEWRRQAGAADAVLVSAPEYAGALAGAVKNAFDWLVGSGELYGKPVAVMSAGSTGGPNARQMLAQTLTWQGGLVVAEVGVAAPRTKIDEAGHVTDHATVHDIERAVDTLVAAPVLATAEVVDLARATIGGLGIDTARVVATS